MVSRLKRNKTIVSGIRNGETFRGVASRVGVHHRTAQRVAVVNEAYSARSKYAEPTDFSKKGLKVFLKHNPNRDLWTA